MNLLSETHWWRFVVAMEFRKILAFRTDFWVTFLGQTLVQLLIARALWQSVFAAQGTAVMQGYTLSTMTLYYLIVPIGTRMLTGENIGFISREIYDGSFTRYLIYPLSFFQYKTLTYLTHSLFYGIQLILLFSVFNVFFSEEPFTLLKFSALLQGTALFLIASLAYVMMAASVELLALWADNIWSLMVMMRFFTSFFGGGFIPLTFFPDWGQRLLELTPFPYFVSLPVRTILGLSTTQEILAGTFILTVWAMFFWLLSRFIWARGQKLYAGVGI
jgi:ABC-2 type transport system permease protein